MYYVKLVVVIINIIIVNLLTLYAFSQLLILAINTFSYTPIFAINAFSRSLHSDIHAFPFIIYTYKYNIINRRLSMTEYKYII